jgi:hypothetical protein
VLAAAAAAIAQIIAASREDHSINLGNPFHMDSVLSSTKKEKKLSLMDKITSWTTSIGGFLE